MLYQVRSALVQYAITQGRMRLIFDAHEVEWDQAAATKLVESAVKQIADSLTRRGVTSYSLSRDGQVTAAGVRLTFVPLHFGHSSRWSVTLFVPLTRPFSLSFGAGLPATR